MGIVKSKSISADADDDFSHFSVKGSLGLVAKDQRIIRRHCKSKPNWLFWSWTNINIESGMKYIA